MNQLVKWIKNIFCKKHLALNEAKEKKENVNTKEVFLDSLKVESNEESVVLLQIRFEEGFIKEDTLNKEQIIKIKDLYCDQIGKLINLISSYKQKLNVNE